MFKPVQSLQRGLLLIEAISVRREGVNLKELAQVINCSSAATYHLVQTLADSGFAQRLESPARYVLGDKLVHLLSNETQDRYYTIVHEEMFKLQKQLPGSGLFYSEYVGNQIAVRTTIDAKKPKQLQRQGNHILPPYLSAGSAVHIAYWTDEIRDQYMQTYPYQSYGQLVWGEWENYEKLMTKTRKDGCVLIPEHEPTRLKLGLPIIGGGGTLMAALTIQWHQTQRKGLREKIKHLKTISRLAGQRITDRLQGA